MPLSRRQRTDIRTYSWGGEDGHTNTRRLRLGSIPEVSNSTLPPTGGITRSVSVDQYVPRLSCRTDRSRPQFSSMYEADQGSDVYIPHQEKNSRNDSVFSSFAQDNAVRPDTVQTITCDVGTGERRGSGADSNRESAPDREPRSDAESRRSSDVTGLAHSGRLLSSVDQPGTTRILRIKVISGTNLAKKDIFGASDPYVRITLYRGDREAGIIDTIHTATIKKTLNPKWEEEYVFRVNPRDNVLLFEVFDSNRLTRDDFLGLVEIPLDHTTISFEREDREIACKDYILRPRSIRSRVRGQLWIYLAYVPDSENEETLEDTPTQEPDWELVDGFSTVSLDDTDGTGDAPAASNDVGASGPVQTETPASPLEPLPPGWEEKTDASGRHYYINHNDRTTHWHRPARSSGSVINSTSRQTSQTTTGSAGATGEPTTPATMPSGWEERQDANGRTYYVDHATRRTCWERPTEFTIQAPQSTPEENLTSAAEMYRQRRHVSVEDTISLGPDLNNSSPQTRRQEFSQQPRTQSLNTSHSRVQNQVIEEEPLVDSPAGQNQVIDEEPLPPGWATGVAPNGRIFYINHNTAATTWDDPRKPRSSSYRRSADDTTPLSALRPSSNEDLLKNLGPLPDGWEERTHTDGRVFYINHRTRCTQWEDPRLQTLGGPAVPYSRDFKRKYDYFRSKLRKPSNVPNKLDIKVSRKNVFEDSYRAVMSVKRSELLKTRLWIEFDGEVGLDYGGVSREWFFLLSREMFNPYYGLYEYSATDNYTLQINSLSGIFNEEHLTYYQFVGRIAGMAVYHGKLLDAFFIRPFYKMMLGKKITLDDMESVDSEYYNSMCYIRDNDPECLDLYFSIEEDYFGEIAERELKPGGKNILVTNENKLEYLDLVVGWRFVARVENQMKNFMKGFNELIPNHSLQIFDENELELLMCGLQDIDVNDWKTHTAYKGEYNPNHPVILHFWKAIYSFNNETRARFLQFVTGTSRVPMNGFRELHGSNGPQLFTVEKWGTAEKLPRAHTCFNRIDLPPYENYADLRKKLIIAIENAQGFEGVD